MILKAGFVDLLGTMHADPETTPLVAHEYDEWGHPEENQEVMRQLCPMTNLPTDEDEMRHFPAVLATGGEHDRRVPFEMPLKYVHHLESRGGRLCLVIFLSTNYQVHFETERAVKETPRLGRASRRISISL